MSLLCFFKPKDGHLDLRGALSTSAPYVAIAQSSMQKTTSSEKQHGLYKKYSAGLHAEIGKYASYQTTVWLHHCIIASFFTKALQGCK